MQHAPHFGMTKPCTDAGVAKENSDRVDAPARNDGVAMASSTAADQPGANSDEPAAEDVQSEEKTGESAKDDSGAALDVDSSDIESASSSTSSSTDLEQLGEAPTGKLAAKDRQIEIPGPLFQNPKSGVLHKPGSNPSSTVCPQSYGLRSTIGGTTILVLFDQATRSFRGVATKEKVNSNNVCFDESFAVYLFGATCCDAFVNSSSCIHWYFNVD